MAFAPAQLLSVLTALPRARRYVVAYSAGPDSLALLHAFTRIRAELGAALAAVHVNHGLHRDAGEWAGLCREVCAWLDVPVRVLDVAGARASGQSLEAWAREARYGAIRTILAAGDMLCTAHHREDQAETVLLQLARGSGPRGLAAMPALAVFAPGWLARPLLEVPRAALREYAARSGARWIEDDANQDLAFDRSFVRARVLPLLRERWPGIDTTLARSAGLQAEAGRVLEEVGREDLRGARRPGSEVPGVRALLALSPRRRRNALRTWIAERGLPMPARSRMRQLSEQLLEPAPDREPCVRWANVAVRRYRDGLYVDETVVEPEPGLILVWLPGTRLELPHGRLELRRSERGGLAARVAERELEVRLRAGGERCRPVDRRHGQSLKRLFQERGVPPWERRRTPLIYCGGELAAVAGLWVCAGFEAPPGEAGWQPVWTPHEP